MDFVNPVIGQLARDEFGRLDFFETEFGVLVELMPQADQIGMKGPDGFKSVAGA